MIKKFNLLSLKKFIWSLVLMILGISTLKSQNNETVLMTVGNTPVTVEEFKYIYEKNNGKSSDYSKTSIEEYLNLYTKFKLKVLEAKAQKLDTIPTLIEELEGYKMQLSTAYLMDKGVNEYLLNDLKAKLQKDVKIAHIFIALPQASTDSLQKAALSKINAAYAKLQTGATFEAVAKEFSEDKNSKDKGGDIGFYTAMMPNGFFEFENAMYQTTKGQYSKPIQTRIGWHIIRPLEDRIARGEIEVAHILIRNAENNDPMQIAKTIYDRIIGGTDWETIMQANSEDNQTKDKGGVLPKFGINTYEKSFEEAAFGLKNVGDISLPTKTLAGAHVIKLISKSSALSAQDFKKTYEPKIKADERVAIAKKSFLRDIRIGAGFKENNTVLSSFLKTLDESFYTYKWQSSTSPSNKEVVLSFGADFVKTLKQFSDFAEKNSKIRLRYDKLNNTLTEALQGVYDAFLEESTIEYERLVMAKKYPDFRSLLREYEEGILIFEITKNEVWDKANVDTVGLLNFYNANSNKYLGEEKASVRTTTINTNDEKLATAILKDAITNDLPKLIKKYNKKQTVITSSDIEMTKEELARQSLEWKVGSISPMQKLNNQNVYSFYTVIKLLPAKPKPLKETRGFVVADYQEALEKMWIEGLMKKYKTTVNNDVLASLIK
jgi:peptidyl-prolyl cis-trans isomerase SurA